MLEIQGHRGARGLLPENTLPSFEAALDAGAHSIETDLHLTKDDVVVLYHDARVTDRLCVPHPRRPRLVRSMTLKQLRRYRVGDAKATPVAQHFAKARGFDPYAIPTLDDLFLFVANYAASPKKTATERARARLLIFDLELKRVPFEPETIGDGFTGAAAGLLERLVLAAVHRAGVLDRVRVRSFDHRAVRAIKQREPTLQTAILIYETAPCHVARLLEDAGADVYCPDYRFIDEGIVRQVHAAKKKIIPYTVNDEADWERLIAWRVDGITTDYPSDLAEFLEPSQH